MALIDTLFAEYEALKEANADTYNAVVYASVNDQDVPKELRERFAAYVVESRKLSRKLADAVKQTVQK